MKLYIVFSVEDSTPSGFDISGVFDDRNAAWNWIRSEGNGQRCMETGPGPIDWAKMERIAQEDRGFWE